MTAAKHSAAPRFIDDVNTPIPRSGVLIFHRAIWLTFFAVGAAALIAVLGAFDAWATAYAFPGTEAYCRGSLVGNVPLSRTPLCVALWFNEAKTWVFYARDIVAHGGQGLYLHELVRTADVGLWVVGAIAIGVALNWLWATAMMHVTLASVAASYTLLQGLSHMLGRRAA